MAIRIDGKETAALVRREVAAQVQCFREKNGRTPCLAVILVGEDPASQVYVRNKEKACAEVGIESRAYRLPAQTRTADLLTLIDTLNAAAEVDGILVQLPLPKHIPEEEVLLRILPEKDVDAFHPVNAGKLLIGDAALLPCTPAGIMELLHRYAIPVAGKRCVVIGRSNIVGKPAALLLLAENGTVTVCHSKTENLAKVTQQADILVVAIGRPRFLTADMVKPGSTVIDVGINRGEDGKLCGDVDFAAVEPVVGYLTPVPGGVGPMTIAMLMRNTLTAARLRTEKNP